MTIDKNVSYAAIQAGNESIVLIDTPEMHEKLRDAYWQGIECSDEQFRQYGRDLVQTLAQSPGWCVCSGARWSDARFNQHKEELVAAIAEHACYSASAGCDWTDDRFSYCEERLVRRVATDAEWSLFAGWMWKEDRFLRNGNVLVDAVTRDPRASYLSICNWHPTRTALYRSRLEEAANSSEYYRDALAARARTQK